MKISHLCRFWTGFSKNPSFKIAMSGRPGGHRPRFTCAFWLTNFFQSDMLPLFFSGLLSYLVGMKGRTSSRVACKMVSCSLLFLIISPEQISKPDTCVLHIYIFGIWQCQIGNLFLLISKSFFFTTGKQISYYTVLFPHITF